MILGTKNTLFIKLKNALILTEFHSLKVMIFGALLSKFTK